MTSNKNEARLRVAKQCSQSVDAGGQPSIAHWTVMAVADTTTQVRRTQSLWTLPDEHVCPDTKHRATVRREHGERFQSRIEGIIAGLEELKILREMHARLVEEATMASKKKATSAARENDDKASRGLDNDQSVGCY